jgi:hypothetical protein
MNCSSCDYLRKKYNWYTCCICKMKKAFTRSAIQVHPYQETDDTVGITMIKIQHSREHTSLVYGSREYTNILKFRKLHTDSDESVSSM